MSFEEFPLNEDFQGYAATSKVEDTQQRKKRRTKPCIHCRKRKTKCVRDEASIRCLECIRRNLNCVLGDQITNDSDPGCDNCQYKRKHCSQTQNGSCYDCSIDHLTCINTGYKIINLNSNFNELNFKNNEIVLSLNSKYESNLDEVMDSNIYKKNNVLFKPINDLSNQLNLSFINEIQTIINPLGSLLIETFFKYFNSNIPILSKEQELLIKNNSEDQLNPLLLNMIYLISIKFIGLESNIMVPLIDITKLENLSILLLNELKDNSIEMIQSLILLIYYNFKSNEYYNENSYFFLNKLVSIVEINGYNFYLNLLKEYKIVLWQIIKLDKFLSILEFKPSKTINWDVDELDINDFTDNKVGDVNLSVVNLALSCDKLMNSLFNYKSFKADSLETVLEKSIKFTKDLNQWYNSLPNEIESTITINLHYYLLLFLNYRRLINKVIEENESVEYISNIKDQLIKHLTSFNDILLISSFKSILEYQLIPNYLSNCFINYYVLLKLLEKLQLNVTGLIQSYELKSKQISTIKELKLTDYEEITSSG